MRGIKHVVNLVDWEAKSKERDKFFSRRIAEVLERAYNEVQDHKNKIKESIRKYYGDSKVPRTPKRKNPTEALLKQIQTCKTINFISDDEDDESLAIKPKELSKELLFIQKLQNLGIDTRPTLSTMDPASINFSTTNEPTFSTAEPVEPTPNLSATEPPTKPTPKTPKKVKAKPSTIRTKPSTIRAKPSTMESNEPIPSLSTIELTSIKATPKLPKKIKAKPVTLNKKPSIYSRNVAQKVVVLASKVRRSSVLRKQKLLAKQQNNEDKELMAIQQKKNLLRERAEMTKREREERQRRVEQNNKLKEAQAREKAEFVRIQAERMRQFKENEAQRNNHLFKSPGKNATKSPAKINNKANNNNNVLAGITSIRPPQPPFGASSSRLAIATTTNNNRNVPPPPTIINKSPTGFSVEAGSSDAVANIADSFADLNNQPMLRFSLDNSNEPSKPIEPIQFEQPKTINLEAISSMENLSSKHQTPARKSSTAFIPPFKPQPLNLTESPGSFAVPKKRSKSQKNEVLKSKIVAPTMVGLPVPPIPNPKSPAYVVNVKQFQKPQVPILPPPPPSSNMAQMNKENANKTIELDKSAYEMTPDKKLIPSTAENYNVDDLSSGDETDNDEHPRKVVPKWAQKSAVARHENMLRRHLSEGQKERYFGRIKQPNIEDFFDKTKKNYPLRNSSAVWTSPMSDPTPGESRFVQFNYKK